MTSAKRDPTPSPLDSQEALVRSIARAVQADLPASDSQHAIRNNVEEALRTEARRNELNLAVVRAGILGTLLLLALLRLFSSEGSGLEPWAFPLLALVLFAGASTLAVALASGWYRPVLRRAAPTADALVIALGFLVVVRSTTAVGDTAPVEGYTAAAVAATLLAFSGALRLSRSAVRLSSAAALLAWAAVCVYGSVPGGTAAIVAAMIIATGVLAFRFIRMIRRVVTEEVGRLRLGQLYRKAQEAIDAREEVLRIVSHDLRNPLNTISMAADLLLSKADDPVAIRHLGIVKRQGERMKHLVCDLLDVARIEAGNLPIESWPVELADLLERVSETMGPLAEDKGLSLQIEPMAGLPPVLVDPERIHQVFSNLIGNAIKFTPEGGRIIIRASGDQGKIRMAVADTGPGIPSAQLPEIFNRMWQSNRNDQRGIGLGLTIAQAIVDAHEETIGVDSTPGKGTEFWFTMAALPMPRSSPSHLS